MKHIFLLSVMVVLVLAFSSSAQTYTLYTSDNSDLPWNQVFCIDFDQNGNIWFGGQRDPGTGVARVSKLSSDLSTWTVYNQNDLALPEDRVFYMACDASNDMWMCTHYGLSVLRNNGTAEIISWSEDHYTRTVEVDQASNVYLSDRDTVAILVTPDGGLNWNLWTATDIGMSSGRPEIYDLREDSQGQLWLCTWYGVFYRDLSNMWHAITQIEGYYTYAMAMTPDDHMWVPDDDTQELYEILPDESVVIHDSTQIDILSNPINDLETDLNGDLWLATSTAGLIHFTPPTYTQYDVASTGGQIPQDNITHLEIRDNIIWMSTADSGIVRIEGLITSIDDEQNELIPQTTELSQNYPNPFNPTTTIDFYLNRAGQIELTIYDILGNKLATAASGEFTAGKHSLIWSGKDAFGNQMASGVYLYQLKTPEKTLTRKMMLMK